jgi:hypothetical protein
VGTARPLSAASLAAEARLPVGAAGPDAPLAERHDLEEAIAGAIARARAAWTDVAVVRISSDECESIMRMVRNQLDVSLHRRLGAG